MLPYQDVRNACLSSNENMILDKILQWEFLDEYPAQSSAEVSDNVSARIYKSLKELFGLICKEVEQIKGLSGQFKAASENLADTSSNVSRATDFIAKGAARQSDDAEKCMRITDNFNWKMNEIDEHATALLELTNRMAEVNANGSKAIADLTKNQNENRRATDAMVSGIYKLIDDIRAVGKVLDVLDGVTEQTKLLSFNAAIEGAHAGAHGKVFRVFADEVKRLSEESKSAGETIQSIIENITNQLNDLNGIVGSSQKVFEDQRQLVGTAVQDFEQLSRYISTFHSEQTSFHNQIIEIKNKRSDLVSSISNMIAFVQNSSATAEEVATLAMGQNSYIAFLKKLTAEMTGRVDCIAEVLGNIKVTRHERIRKKVSVIFDIEDAFWVPVKREFIKAAKLYDLSVDIYAPPSRSTMIDDMAKKLEKVCDEKPDALIISPLDSPAIKEKLSLISSLGIKIIFINSTIPNVRYESLIETDGLKAGQAAAQATKKLLRNKGEVIVGIWSDARVSSVDNRAKGFIEELRANSDIMVYPCDIISGATYENAEIMIGNMFKQHPNSDLIFSTNASWGVFYARYVKLHYPNVKVITMDFTPEIRNAIENSTIDSAIAQRGFLWGMLALEFMDQVFQGKTVQNYVDTGTYEVNLSNIKIYENRV